MGAEHHIARIQVGAHTRGDCLLPHIGVAGTMDQPALVAARELFLGVPYDQHGPVQIRQILPAGRRHLLLRSLGSTLFILEC
jgi:hypothetical protein